MYIDYFPGFFMPADRDPWVDRLLSGTRALRDVLGVSFTQAHSGTNNHPTQPGVDDLGKFFSRRLKTRNRWFSLFSGRHFPKDYYNFGGAMYADDRLFKVMLVTPELTETLRERMLVSLGDALEIHSVQYTPGKALWRQRLAHWSVQLGGGTVRHALEDRTSAESALPVILESSYAGLSPLQPHHFGWLNYWSKEVCDAIGFRERASATDLLRHSYETPRGAWIVKLSAEPPAIVDEDFARRLVELYAAFPEVARRI